MGRVTSGEKIAVKVTPGLGILSMKGAVHLLCHRDHVTSEPGGILVNPVILRGSSEMTGDFRGAS